MQKNFRQLALAVMGSAVVAACGGGGGSSAPAANNSTPSGAQGLWVGTTADNRTLSGIVLSDGTFYMLYSFVGNPASIAGVIQGNGSTLSSSISSSNAKDFNFEGNGILPVTVSASFTAKTSLNGSVSYTNTTNTFTSTYDTDYDATPSLATLAGSYSAQVTVSGGTQTATLTIATNGAISGNVSGCAISGTAVPRSDGNVYDTSVTFNGSSCPFANQTFHGAAYYRASAGMLYSVSLNADRSAGILFAGSRLAP
ncbi:MAG: hypothetical protein HGA47_06440 [Zoogloea sp.]|nr:hypothetical protein [Zoogloea sp.]